MDLSVDERKRRAQIIRFDSKAEYWSLIKSELQSISNYKKKEALAYIAKGKNTEALECANQAIGIDIAIECPEEILKAHDNIFNRVTAKVKELVK